MKNFIISCLLIISCLMIIGNNCVAQQSQTADEQLLAVNWQKIQIDTIKVFDYFKYQALKSAINDNVLQQFKLFQPFFTGSLKSYISYGAQGLLGNLTATVGLTENQKNYVVFLIYQPIDQAMASSFYIEFWQQNHLFKKNTTQARIWTQNHQKNFLKEIFSLDEWCDSVPKEIVEPLKKAVRNADKDYTK